MSNQWRRGKIFLRLTTAQARIIIYQCDDNLFTQISIIILPKYGIVSAKRDIIKFPVRAIEM